MLYSSLYSFAVQSDDGCPRWLLWDAVVQATTPRPSVMSPAREDPGAMIVIKKKLARR